MKKQLLLTGLITAILLSFASAAYADFCHSERMFGEWNWCCNVEWLKFPLSPEGDKDCADCGDDYYALYCDTDIIFYDLGPNYYCVSLPCGDYKIIVEGDRDIEDLDLAVSNLDGCILSNGARTSVCAPGPFRGWYDGWYGGSIEGWVEVNTDEDMPFIEFMRCCGQDCVISDTTGNISWIEFTIHPCPRHPRICILIEVLPSKFENGEDNGYFTLSVLEEK